MPLPPPPADALTRTGSPTRSTAAAMPLVRLILRRLARHDGNARRLHQPPRRDLRAHLRQHARRADRRTRCPPSRTPRRTTAFSDRKPYPGCTASAPLRRAASIRRVDRQVALQRRRRSDVHGPIGGGDMRGADIGVRVDRDGLDAELAACADDAQRDLAAVRDEDAFDHRDQRGGRLSRNARNPSWPSARPPAGGDGVGRERRRLVRADVRHGSRSGSWRPQWPPGRPSPSSAEVARRRLRRDPRPARRRERGRSRTRAPPGSARRSGTARGRPNWPIFCSTKERHRRPGSAPASPR